MSHEQQSIKTAAKTVFFGVFLHKQDGIIIDWHSQEEDPVRDSPRGRGTQPQFQAEVLFFFFFFCMFQPGPSKRKVVVVGG